MTEITLTVPDETMFALKGGTEAVGAELRLLAALKLFEMGRLSSGAAASLAGLPRTLFLAKLGEYGVMSTDLSPAELRQDLEAARGHR